MKYRWLLMFACLLMTACSQKSNENSDATAASESESGETSGLAAPSSEGNPAAVEAPSPEAKYASAQSKYKTALEKFIQEYEAADDADREALAKEKYPKAEEYADEFMQIAVEHPDSEVAFDSLCWIVSNARSGNVADRAFNSLVANHGDNEAIKNICMDLSYGDPGPLVESRLNQLIENSDHDSVKASATYALASYLSRLSQARQYVASHPDQDGFSEASVSYLNERIVATKDIEALHQSLISNFPDLKPRAGSKRTYRKMAEQALFEIQNLAIGMTAPEIEGDDLDGVTFKLSDYRGKVVVLDFWGDW